MARRLTRLYLGKLPADTRSEEVSTLFEKYGRVVDVRVMTGFGFVEFESSKDAEDAVHEINGKSFLGSNIVVEFAKENRSRRSDYDAPERSFQPRRRPAGIRITVDNISRDTSWQDLKDFGREAGSVTYADIDRDVPGRGILEYLSRVDAEHAVQSLDKKELRGQPVHVSLAEDRGGPDNFRRDEGYRGDRYKDRDRGRDDRYRDERLYRGRSSSPPLRRDDRARSPRKDYEDRKSARDDFYEKASDKPRSDRRRGDDRDSRYDDRPSRASGDGGWSRS